MYLDLSPIPPFLQKPRHNLIHPNCTSMAQAQVTGIPQTERQSLRNDHLSTLLQFLSLPLSTGPYN